MVFQFLPLHTVRRKVAAAEKPQRPGRAVYSIWVGTSEYHLE
jgi:hypothetical protein